MSRLRGPWKLLEIEPTDDVRAIRRAYAAKLKAIDVDRDPQAFIALREAFDQAQAEARWINLPAAEEDEAPDAEADDESDDWDEDEPFTFNIDTFDRNPMAVELALAPRAPNPWEPRTADDYDDHARALATLLLGEHAEPWPDADEADAMFTHWERIVRDPRMQEMSFYADAENWFADLIARAVPFSDPLVAPVSDFFGWMRAQGEISQTHAIAYVVRRRQSLTFFDAIRRPDHPFHAAYRELARPAHEHSRRGWVRRKKVRELLATVRTHYPELEDNFDSYRVSLWEPVTQKRSWNWTGMIVVWILIALLNFANSQCSRKNGYVPLPSIEAPDIQLSNDRVDIDRALERLYGGELSIATVEARNPELYGALLAHWKQALARRDDMSRFTEYLRLFLNQRVQAGLGDAPLSLLRDYHRLTLERAKALRDASPASPAICANFLSGKSDDTSNQPEALRDRTRALVARTLLETHPDPKPATREKTFMIPGALVAKATKRAGMTRAQMGQALRFEGEPGRQCAGRIAFLETVLAEPDDEVGNILRAM